MNRAERPAISLPFNGEKVMTFPSATEYLNIYETQKGTFTVIAHIEGLGRRTVVSLSYHSEALLSFGFENDGNVYLVPASRIIAFELD